MSTDTKDVRFCLLRSGGELEIAAMTESQLHESGRERDLVGVPFHSRSDAEEQRYFLVTAGFHNAYAAR